MSENKFRLNYGCHRGTLVSRDSSSSTHDTYKEAHAAYIEHRSFFRSIGYQIWYADIIKPDGKKCILKAIRIIRNLHKRIILCE